MKEHQIMEIMDPKYAGLAMTYPYGLAHCASLLRLASMLNAELILGTLKSGCKGQGICKVLPLGSKISAGCRAVKATLIKMDEQRLHIMLYPKGGCLKIRHRLLHRDTFIMEESFLLPDWVCEWFAFDSTLAIPAGEYPIVSFDESVAISVQLQAVVRAAARSDGGKASVSACNASVGTYSKAKTLSK